MENRRYCQKLWRIWDLLFHGCWQKEKKKWDSWIREKAFITHSKSSSQSFTFVWINSSIFPKSHGGNAKDPWWMLDYRGGTWSLGEIITFIENKSKPTHSRLLPANTTQRDGPGSQGFAFLEYPERMCRVTQAHGKLPLSTWAAKPLKIWISWACQGLWLPKKAGNEEDISMT